MYGAGRVKLTLFQMLGAQGSTGATLFVTSGPNMQERLHKIAVRLSWLQPLALIAGGLAVVAIGYIAFDTGVETEQYLVPAILLCCWCLLVFTLINLFQTAPPSLDQTRGFFRRLAVRFHRFLRNIMALSFLGLTGALILLSYRLLTTGVG